MLGVVLTLQIVMFAYQGVELVGVTAGEAANPEKTLPHAINSVVYRILIFYIGALIIIMAVVPWTEFTPGVSPFVLVFEKIGIPGAAGIINFVVITAAASSCNSGIFSTGRMLYTLAQFGQAPRAFGTVNARHVPSVGITASAALMLVGVGLNYFVPEQVFVWVTSVALVGSLWTWGMIVYRSPEVPPVGCRRAGQGEQFPHAVVPVRLVDRAGVPGAGDRLDGLFPRHARGADRRSGLAGAANVALSGPGARQARGRRHHLTVLRRNAALVISMCILAKKLYTLRSIIR